MIKIFSLFYTGKYSPDYVTKLYRGLKRNIKVPFKYHVYSDTNDIECDEIIPLRKNKHIKAHWHKLKFFDSLFTGAGEIIVLDIDQIILKDITEMVIWPVKSKNLLSYESWWNNDPVSINGGWYKFNAGDFDYVWEKYISDPDYWQNYFYERCIVHFKYFGEQNFVEKCLFEKRGNVITYPGEWVGKWTHNFDQNLAYQQLYRKKFNQDYMILGDDVNPKLKIVHFANPDNSIHQNKYNWVDEYWND